MINSISIALTGLESATKRLNASASNIANLQTVGSLEDGKQAPFNPLTTQSEAIAGSQGNGQGVQTTIVQRDNPFVLAYDPNSPFADKNGIIGVPNINLAEETVNINLAKIQFEANIATLKTAEELSDEIFRIFDKKV